MVGNVVVEGVDTTCLTDEKVVDFQVFRSAPEKQKLRKKNVQIKQGGEGGTSNIMRNRDFNHCSNYIVQRV